MRYLIAFMLVFCASCSSVDKSEKEFKTQKISLEREVEILELKRRRAALQLSVMRLERQQDVELTSD